MTTSDVTITIDGNNVSNYVRDVDIYKTKSTGIGSCDLVINNTGDAWGDMFDPNDAVEVAINGQLMFSGYVDTVMPTLGKKGVLTEWMTVKSRDDGRILTDLSLTTDRFIDVDSGDIIADILLALGDPLIYTPPIGGAPNTTYKCQRTYLSDAVVDISQLVGWDFYIDTTGELFYFEAGTVDSTVDLLSVAGGASNNLLNFEEYESIGNDIKNYIEIHAGSTKDHWTNGNAADWETFEGVGSTIIDWKTTYMRGGASLSVELGSDDETVGLDFSDGKYSQGGVIDMSKDLGQATISVIPKYGSDGTFSFEPTLTDTNGIMIHFYRTSTGSGSKGHTKDIDASEFSWRVISFPVGEHDGNKITTRETNGKWYYRAGTRTEITRAGLYTSAILVDDNGDGRGTITADGATPFSTLSVGDAIELIGCTDSENNGTYYIHSATDLIIILTSVLPTSTNPDTSIVIYTSFNWDRVEEIGARIKRSGAGTLDYVYIDLLYIPTVEAKSISEDTGVGSSQALYGKRMYSEFRKELTTQEELDNYATRTLALKKDPVKKFKALAIGQTDTKYAAQTVDVQAPGFGVPALTDYIIVTLHHRLHNDKNERGWDFTTEYDLAYTDVDATRIIYTEDPVQKRLQAIREADRKLRGAVTTDDAWLADIMTGIFIESRTGATFPTDFNEGDIFLLTADYVYGGIQYYGPATYKYNSTADTWIRDPMDMYRAADPPVGGEMDGDYYYNTTTLIRYQWTGAAWVQLNYAATVISGTLSSSQLKKGIQPFDSAVFFYPIRAVASSTTTFDIDVNDAGSGKTTITASGLTPFSNFTAGDELIVQGCEDEDNNSIVAVIDSVGGAGLSITLTGMLGGLDTDTDETCIVTARDAVRWVGVNPAVYFGDGTSQQVVTGRNTGGDLNLALGPHWIYFSTADTDAHITADYATAIGDTVGIICRLEITSDSEPLIMPVYSRGGNMTLDFLGAGAVDTLVLTSNAIIGKDFRTAAGVGVAGGPVGVKFDKTGIYGYSGGIVKTFDLASTTGVVSVYGEGKFVLKKADETIVGYLDMLVDDGQDVLLLQTVGAGGDIVLESSGYILRIRGDTGDIDIDGKALMDFGDTSYSASTSSRLILPRFEINDPNAGAPRNCEVWMRTDL